MNTQLTTCPIFSELVPKNVKNLVRPIIGKKFSYDRTYPFGGGENKEFEIDINENNIVYVPEQPDPDGPGYYSEHIKIFSDNGDFCRLSSSEFEDLISNGKYQTDCFMQYIENYKLL